MSARDGELRLVVHQLLSGAGPTDAITSEALAFRACFARWGWGGADHAYRIAPGADRCIRPAATLAPAAGDLLVVHHSAGWPDPTALARLPCAKLLLYHNVTPAAWLWEDAPVVAAHCAAGRAQLPELLAGSHAVAADSQFNAAELRALGAAAVTVIPLLVDLARLWPAGAGGVGDQAAQGVARDAAPAPSRDAAPGPTRLLFVGRLSPHKRQDELIATLAAYRRYRDPDARLALVGDPVTAAYRERLRALAARLAPGAVRIESDLAARALGARYREAHAFVCLSAHEGFCVPLLEAMHMGVPVIARPAGAVAETLGDAGLLVDDGDPAVLCELIWLVRRDRELRALLAARGRRRAEGFAARHVEPRLREAVIAAAAAGRQT